MASTPGGLYGIVRGSDRAARLTEGKRRQENDNFIFGMDANLSHIPRFYVGIFNVSDLEQRVERPWVHPQRLGQVIIISACEPNEKYSRPFVIPDIVQMRVEQAGSWILGTRGQDGRFLAQDAVNPEDPRGNWRTMRDIGAGVAANEGTNLYRMGCFWTTTDTMDEKGRPVFEPDDPELIAAAAKAHERLEETYNRLYAEANLLFLQGAEGVKQINGLHRRAANYLGLTPEWNRKFERKTACPNCDEPNSPKAAICINPRCGIVFNWQNAIKFGLRTIEQAMAAGVIPEQAKSFAEEPAPKTARKGRKKAV